MAASRRRGADVRLRKRRTARVFADGTWTVASQYQGPAYAVFVIPIPVR